MQSRGKVFATGTELFLGAWLQWYSSGLQNRHFAGSSPAAPEQVSSELRRLSHELGTRTKLEIMDSVVILEHMKVEEFLW